MLEYQPENRIFVDYPSALNTNYCDQFLVFYRQHLHFIQKDESTYEKSDSQEAGQVYHDASTAVWGAERTFHADST